IRVAGMRRWGKSGRSASTFLRAQPVSIGSAPSLFTSSSCFLPVLLPSFWSLAGVTLTGFGGGVFSIALASLASLASAFGLVVIAAAGGGVELGVVVFGAGVVGVAAPALAAAGAALGRPSTFTTDVAGVLFWVTQCPTNSPTIIAS